MDLKDFYLKAMLLPDNEAIVIKYEISKKNIGKIQLANSVKLLNAKTTKELKKVLKFIEQYATEYYFIPIHNSPVT